MGYESKIYFVRPFHGLKEEYGLAPSHIVAMIDMCKMGYSEAVMNFQRMFDAETDFTIPMMVYDDEMDAECLKNVCEDMYGERLKYCKDKKKLVDQMETVMKFDMYSNKRFKQLKKLLEAFVDDDEVYVVHYGY